MPFKSKKQMRWMFANEPEMAKDWVKKYGTPKEESMPNDDEIIGLLDKIRKIGKGVALEEGLIDSLAGMVKRVLDSVFGDGWTKKQLLNVLKYTGVSPNWVKPIMKKLKMENKVMEEPVAQMIPHAKSVEQPSLNSPPTRSMRVEFMEDGVPTYMEWQSANIEPQRDVKPQVNFEPTHDYSQMNEPLSGDEGGPGSGQKGHTTAEEPTTPRQKKAEEPTTGFKRSKIMNGDEANRLLHNEAEVKNSISKGMQSLSPQDAKALSSVEQEVSRGINSKSMNMLGDKYKPERQRLHSMITKKILGNAKPSPNPSMIALGGVAGSGKSSIIKKALEGTNYAIIDNDAIKAFLPEYKQKGVGGAMFTHDEASEITKEIINHCIQNKIPFVLDSTLRNPDKYRSIINTAKSKGFKTQMMATQLPTHKAIDRAVNRYQQEGRWVPPSLVAEMGVAVNKSIHDLKNDVDDYQIFDTDVEMGQPAKRIEQEQSYDVDLDNRLRELMLKQIDDFEDMIASIGNNVQKEDITTANGGALMTPVLAKKIRKAVEPSKEYIEPMPEEQADPNELVMGIEVELEHTNDKEEAKVIALQHLAEIPDYYTRLKQMEEEAGVKEYTRVLKDKVIRARYKNAINIPIEVGDTILTGKFLNKKIIVKEIGEDKHGNPTINGRPMLRIRLLNDKEKEDYDTGRRDQNPDALNGPEIIPFMTGPSPDSYVIGQPINYGNRNNGTDDMLNEEEPNNQMTGARPLDTPNNPANASTPKNPDKYFDNNDGLDIYDNPRRFMRPQKNNEPTPEPSDTSDPINTRNAGDDGSYSKGHKPQLAPKTISMNLEEERDKMAEEIKRYAGIRPNDSGSDEYKQGTGRAHETLASRRAGLYSMRMHYGYQKAVDTAKKLFNKGPEDLNDDEVDKLADYMHKTFGRQSFNREAKVGQKVQVHPQLTTDPLRRQGEYGTIVKINGDVISIKFADGKVGQYESDAIQESFRKEGNSINYKGYELNPLNDNKGNFVGYEVKKSGTTWYVNFHQFSNKNQSLADAKKWVDDKGKQSLHKEYSGALKKELDDIKKHYDDFTTSDLQGVVQALGMKYGEDDDKMLKYIYKQSFKKEATYQEDDRDFDVYAQKKYGRPYQMLGPLQQTQVRKFAYSNPHVPIASSIIHYDDGVETVELVQSEKLKIKR